MTRSRLALLTLALGLVLAESHSAISQQARLAQVCADAKDIAPFCSAVRGDRSEGWVQQTRSEVMGRNAIDAAVATAAMLNVVFPQNVGIGGDLFALIYVAKEKKVYQLNASGITPAGLTLDRMHPLGYKAGRARCGPGSGMPSGGILTVTVPGSLWGWQEVLTRFGTKTFKDVLQPAIDYAEQGFPVTEEIQSSWRMKNALPLKGCCTQIDPDSAKTFYIEGNRPTTGTIFRNPD